jgi:hypothetical protein
MQAERNDRRELHLVASGGTRGIEMAKFKVGDEVRESGIYRVIHRQHRVPHEVTLLEHEHFPPCQRCNEAVDFELVRSVPRLSETGLMVLHVLPVMEEIDTTEGTASAAA